MREMMKGKKRAKNTIVSLFVVAAMVGLIVVFSIFNKNTDPKKPPIGKVTLTKAQAEIVMQDTIDEYYTHTKIKEVQTNSLQGATIKTTNIYTEGVAYSVREASGNGLTETISSWVCKDSGNWYLFEAREVNNGVNVAADYSKSSVVVENDDARYVVGEIVQSANTFVDAFTENEETTIIYDVSSTKTRETFVIKNNKMINMTSGEYNESTGKYETTLSINYSYDSAVTDTIPELPSHPWKEMLTKSQALAIMEEAKENFYDHDKVKSVARGIFYGLDITITNISTPDMLYTIDETEGFEPTEYWVCKDGEDWFLYIVEEFMGEITYSKSPVTVPNDNAICYIDEEEEELSDDAFVEAYTVGDLTTIVFQYYDIDEGTEVRDTYYVKNGERYQAKSEKLDDITEEFVLFAVAEYTYDEAVTETVPPLPTLPEGEEWE